MAPRLGVIIDELTQHRLPAAARLAALDAWIARAGGHAPDVAPLWANLAAGSGVDRHMVRGLVERGIEPAVYAESSGAPYVDILAGKYDTHLALLGCQAAGLALRWDQEPDGSGLGAKWQRPAERALYAETWVYVQTRLWDAGDVRLIWSPIDPERAFAMGLWPGIEHVSVMGFTRFHRDADTPPPSQRARGPVRKCNAIAPGLPVWWTEAGIEAGLPGRAAYIRDLPNVAGVEAMAVFDMLIELPAKPPERPEPIRDDWRWNRHMYAAWGNIRG